MGSYSLRDEQIAEIYREERMLEADQERLISQFSDQRSSRSNPISAILNGLGKLLVLLGKRLQRRQISRKMT